MCIKGNVNPVERLLLPANEVWGKVICLQVCVCPQGVPGLRRSGSGGLVLGGAWSQGVPGPSGCLVQGVWSWGVSGPGGCLVLGGACSQGKSGPGGLPGGDPPDGYCCGQYAS